MVPTVRLVAVLAPVPASRSPLEVKRLSCTDPVILASLPMATVELVVPVGMLAIGIDDGRLAVGSLLPLSNGA